MKKYIYDLNRLDKGDRRFFCEMLSYVSENIVSTEISGGEVTVSYEGTSEKSILDSIKFLEDTIKLKLKNTKAAKMETRILSDHTSTSTINGENIFPELLAKHFARRISPGAFAYGGLFLDVFRYFCAKVDAFGKELFSGHEYERYEVPELVPVSEYDRGEYFETFPHHIMFESVMKNNISTIDRFAKNGIKDESIFDEMKRPQNVLRTAACMPIYVFLENAKITPEKPKLFLVSGKCFRNEGNNVKELSRLNEFYMKEYVLVGLPEQTKTFIEEAKKLWDFWYDTFHLNCKSETACDSFFASNYKKLRVFQLMGDSKQEFKLSVPADSEYVSCSSANFHRSHFTKIYNITNGETGALCHSACIAFGIDRLAYAFLSQKGLDISKWEPETVAEIRRFSDI